MPRKKKTDLTLEELKAKNEELLEDNKLLAKFCKNLREFNKDLVTDNLASSKIIHEMELEIEGLKAENKKRILERVCIGLVILAGTGLMLAGLLGK